jgi:hypothetical protein
LYQKRRFLQSGAVSDKRVLAVKEFAGKAGQPPEAAAEKMNAYYIR